MLYAMLALALQVGAQTALDAAIARGIESGVFPGAVVVVGTSDRILHARGYGHFTWSADAAVPSPDSTLYDLASLTKVVATTPAAMVLVDEGKLELDRAVQDYLPEFSGEGKEQITLRHLLEHRTGLRAFLPLNERASTAEEAKELVLTEPLRYEPGGRVEYSDLNSMLLGWIVERVSSASLDEFAAERVFAPAGMTETRFEPPRSLWGRVAPVGLWRGYVIAGRLHDQNAVRLGGVSGHAGLYSTGADLGRYAQLLLNGGRAPSGVQVLQPETVREFTRRGPGNRALGWEMRDTTTQENTGALLSSAAYGHGGFTGTSIWIDPTLDLFVILLTNRVFAPRTRRSITRLKEVRAQVADAAVALRASVCGAPDPTAGQC
ncbi:MAG: beta-lactamase family protein [Gemmatimonadota bacterium]|nr:MAG: beta-lactamase family protein [Gemmatimonadota bacterium]